MHHEKVYGLFDDYNNASKVVQYLTQSGYDAERIAMIVNNEDGRLDRYTADDYDEDSDAADGAGFGAIVGTLTAIGTSVVPGVGPLLVLGPAAGALVAGIGAATGAVTGAAVGEAVDFDMDTSDAETYARVLREGGAMVVVDVYSEWTEERIEDAMHEFDPVDVEDSD